MTPRTWKFSLFLTTISLNTVFNNKSVKISSQIYLTFIINHYLTSAIFLVVLHLSVPLILGHDWLLENMVQIDYEHKLINIKSPNLKTPLKLIVDDQII